MYPTLYFYVIIDKILHTLFLFFLIFSKTELSLFLCTFLLESYNFLVIGLSPSAKNNTVLSFIPKNARHQQTFVKLR
jgi:hypothetical protein